MNAQCYVLQVNDTPIAFAAVLHQPTGFVKNIKRISRLVVLPEWQGIGIAGKFLDAVCEIYDSQGFVVTICTSAKNLVAKLNSSTRWKFLRYSNGKGYDPMHSVVNDRRVFSFAYKGKSTRIKPNKRTA